MESRVYAQVIHKSYYCLGMLSDLTQSNRWCFLVSCSLPYILRFVFLIAGCFDKRFNNIKLIRCLCPMQYVLPELAGMVKKIQPCRSCSRHYSPAVIGVKALVQDFSQHRKYCKPKQHNLAICVQCKMYASCPKKQ